MLGSIDAVWIFTGKKQTNDMNLALQALDNIHPNLLKYSPVNSKQ
jgi:hypothetical protein